MSVPFETDTFSLGLCFCALCVLCREKSGPVVSGGINPRFSNAATFATFQPPKAAPQPWRARGGIAVYFWSRETDPCGGFLEWKSQHGTDSPRVRLAVCMAGLPAAISTSGVLSCPPAGYSWPSPRGIAHRCSHTRPSAVPGRIRCPSARQSEHPATAGGSAPRSATHPPPSLPPHTSCRDATGHTASASRRERMYRGR